MTKNISITLEDDVLKYLDDISEINGRSRSSMLNWILKMEMARDAALDEEAKSHE